MDDDETGKLTNGDQPVLETKVLSNITDDHPSLDGDEQQHDDPAAGEAVADSPVRSQSVPPISDDSDTDGVR